MSLEDKIGELTAAVNALTAALAHPAPTLSGRTDTLSGRTDTLSEKEVAPPKSPPTASETSASPTAKEKATASTTNGTISDSGTKDATLTIDYAQVAKAITDTFKVDRAKTIAALGKFGAAKGPQLKPEDYAMFLKVLTS
jgi:hypothetical protein